MSATLAALLIPATSAMASKLVAAMVLTVAAVRRQCHLALGMLELLKHASGLRCEKAAGHRAIAALARPIEASRSRLARRRPKVGNPSRRWGDEPQRSTSAVEDGVQRTASR